MFEFIFLKTHKTSLLEKFKKTFKSERVVNSFEEHNK